MENKKPEIRTMKSILEHIRKMGIDEVIIETKEGSDKIDIKKELEKRNNK